MLRSHLNHREGLLRSHLNHREGLLRSHLNHREGLLRSHLNHREGLLRSHLNHREGLLRSHLNHRAAVIFGVLLLLPLAACSGSSEDCGGYQCGDGAVAQIAVDERGDPVELSGDGLDGTPIDVADYRGKTVVVVVWGSWCGPCNAEAADVVSVANDLGGAFQFVGIDIRDDSVTNAQGFVDEYAVPYPSIYSPDSAALLDFPVALTPRTIPGFAVLDREGRVAASILGELPSKTTLREVALDVAREDDGTVSHG